MKQLKKLKYIFTMLLTMSLVVLEAQDYSSIIRAAVSRTINYQGYIQDNSGNPLNGTYTIQFSLYNDSVNGTPADTPSASGPLLWTETYDQVSGSCAKINVTDGYVRTALGSCNPFPAYLLFNQDYYLGIKIESDNEATPRVVLHGVPFAENVRRITFDDGFNDIFHIGTPTEDYMKFDTANAKLISMLKDLRILSGLLDNSGSYGTNGQILSSTGSGVAWVDDKDNQSLSWDSDHSILSISGGNSVDLSSLNSPWISVPYDGTNNTVYGGNTLIPRDGSNVKGIVINSSDNAINTIRIVNKNDTDNYAGSALVLKGSGNDFRNQLYFGIFGQGFYQTPFQNTALLKARDKDLYIGVHADDTRSIKFFGNVNNSTFQPSMIATFNDNGVYFNSLQNLSAKPTNSGVVMTDLNTGKLLAVDANTLTNNLYTNDGSLTGDRIVTSNGHSLLFTGNSGNSVSVETSDANNNSSYVDIYPDSVETGITDGTNTSTISMDSSGLILDFSNGSNASGLSLTGGLTIFDDINNEGIKYAADYSANFTDRSLVDKAYVDNAINANSITASNGLSMSGNDVRLGGTLDGNTIVYTGGNTLSVSNNNNVNGALLFQNGRSSWSIYSTFAQEQGNKIYLSMFNSSLGSQKFELTDANGFVITDNRHHRGMVYADDYSANYTDRSLVDKAYVDNAISASSMTAGNGLSMSSNEIQLGGTLSQNTYIEHNGFDLIIREMAGEPETSFSGDNLKITDNNNNRQLRLGIAGADYAGLTFKGNYVHNIFYRDDNINISSDSKTFSGLQYAEDYSADYTDRSLVDKAYVDNTVYSLNHVFVSDHDTISNSGPDANVNTNDFVFGSTSLSDDGNNNHKSRFFFDKSKGAFRAGYAPRQEWDDSNVGNYSIALGSGYIDGEGGVTPAPVASGDWSVALGRKAVASGTNSLAGFNSTASGSGSIAFENGTASGINSFAIRGTASGSDSVAIGGTASGSYSVSMGDGTQAGDYAVAMGYLTEASGQNSVSMGQLTEASELGAISMGLSSKASGQASVALGKGVLARSFGEIALGSFNTDYSPASTTDVNAADRLVVIGNGGDDSNRSDAMVMYKDAHSVFNNIINYGADYSSSFTDRTLVDKAYVDSVASGGSITASNGLTMSGNDVQLGGLITSGTYLKLDSNQSLFIDTNGYVGANHDALSAQFYGGDDSTSPAFNVSINTNYGMDSYANFNMRSGLVLLAMDGNNKSINMSSSGFTIRSNDILKLDAPANSVQLVNQPDGTNELSVATVKYVNDHTGPDTDWVISGSNMYSGVSGNVGIGTTSPSYKLSLAGDGSALASGSLELATYADSGYPSGVYFHRARGSEASPTAVTNGLPMGGLMVGGYDGSSMVAYTGGLQMESTEDWSTSGHGTKLLFSTTENGTTGMTTKMVVDHNGNVGIGTTAPGYKLDVDGKGNFTGGLTIGAYTLPNTDGSNGQVLATNGAGVLSWTSVSGSSGIPSAIWDTDNDTGVQVEKTSDEDKIRFDTLGTQRMIIDNNGRVGVNSENWTHNVAVFGNVNTTMNIKQFNSDMSGLNIDKFSDDDQPGRYIVSKARGTETSPTTVQSGDEIMELGSIAYDGSEYVSTGGLIVSVDGSPSSTSVPSKLSFLTTTPGNTGSDEKMVLTANGYLGINTATPAYRLDVAGNARFTAPVKIGDYTLPAVDGSNGQVLQTDGSGNVSWANVSGGTSYWSRSGTTLSPATSGDDVNLPSGSSLSIVDLSAGSLVFADSGGLLSSANGLYWDKGNAFLGIGVVNPSMSLDVAGGIQLTDGIIFANSGAVISAPSSSIEVNTDIIPDTDNSHALGSSSNRWTEVYAVNGTINTSDIRLKKDIRNEPYGLREVMALNPIIFKWKDSSLGNRDKLGFSAQDLQKIIPEVVDEDPKTGRLGVYYSDLIPVLWKAVKEQQAEIDHLNKKDIFGHVKIEADKTSIWVKCPEIKADSVVNITPDKLVLTAVTEKIEGRGFMVEVGEHSNALTIDWTVHNK